MQQQWQRQQPQLRTHSPSQNLTASVTARNQAISPGGSADIQSALRVNAGNLTTRTMEQTMEQFLRHITTFIDEPMSLNPKGRSRTARTMTEAIRKAVSDLCLIARNVAMENDKMNSDMVLAIQNVEECGEVLFMSTQSFAEMPLAYDVRHRVAHDANALLSAIMHLMRVADDLDVIQLQEFIKTVNRLLDQLRAARSGQEQQVLLKSILSAVERLDDACNVRQRDLTSSAKVNDIIAARAQLKRTVPLLASSTTALIDNYGSLSQENQVKVMNEIRVVLDRLLEATQGKEQQKESFMDKVGELAAAIDDFEERILIDPRLFHDDAFRPQLEEHLEGIISGAALLADSPQTRPLRREMIVDESNHVRQALQDLLQQYNICAAHNGVVSDKLQTSVDFLGSHMGELRYALQSAIIDHISDSFIEVAVPLFVLIENAKNGRIDGVNSSALVFLDHSTKLVEVALLSTQLSTDEEGVKFVRTAVKHLESLTPQVINAAKMLVVQPTSRLCVQNMDCFKTAWISGAETTTIAIDYITPLADFILISESHIEEDLTQCLNRFAAQDWDLMDRCAGAVHGRVKRLHHVIKYELGHYQLNNEIEAINNDLKFMMEQRLTAYTRCISSVLEDGNVSNATQSELQRTSADLLAAIRGLRRTLVESSGSLGVGKSTFVAESAAVGVFETIQQTTAPDRHASMSPQDLSYDAKDGEDETDLVSDAATVDPAQEDIQAQMQSERGKLVAQWSPEQRAKIRQHYEHLRAERDKFQTEVTQWDASGNEILQIAKQMCVIMMQMGDFMRNRGPLKCTMDVIQAAKEISLCGRKLDKLAREIAACCPETDTKKDLIAYLQRVSLYCHQLSITSKVKADVEHITKGSTDGSKQSLDSATSLIQAAKNLMNAVVLTVRASYIASTKYTRLIGNKPAVQWKVKLPQKKPIFKAGVYDYSGPKAIRPVRALGEFEPSIADSNLL